MKHYQITQELEEKILWFRRRLRNWFKKNRRNFPWREVTRTPYEVLVAEMMLRQTKADTVSRLYLQFLAKYPDFSQLSKASIENLENILKPLGLWRQRAVIFFNIAQLIKQGKGNLPETREELQAIPHIGQYISSVILTTFHNKTEPFIDVNTARVVDRFFGKRTIVDIRYDPYLKAVSTQIVNKSGESLEPNWAILDFAALVCKAPKPICSICPFRNRCVYFNESLSNK